MLSGDNFLQDGYRHLVVEYLSLMWQATLVSLFLHFPFFGDGIEGKDVPTLAFFYPECGYPVSAWSFVICHF